MGDDHTAESSTNAHATEFLFVDTMIPILNPAGVQELVDYGLYGFALSRFAGTWAAIKCVKDNIESTASVDASLERLGIVIPEFDMPPGGLNIRHEINFLGQEARLHGSSARPPLPSCAPAAQPHHLFGGSKAKIGIITVGKSYLDVRQALEDIGIDEAKANQIGVRLFKVGCPWPLDIEHIKDFARGLEMIVVVEEKRSLIEVQVREDLYGTSMQPTVIGKKDESGDWLFPAKGALDPNEIAIALGERVLKVIGPSEEIAARVSRLHTRPCWQTPGHRLAHALLLLGLPAQFLDQGAGRLHRRCRHRLPLHGALDGSRHGRLHPDGRRGRAVGRPGAVLEARHLFQNLGDGTYNIPASWRAFASPPASASPIRSSTDAVAMTGGQPHEGGLTVDMIARQVHAEGVGRIAVVSDEPGRYDRAKFPPVATFHHRDDLDPVQRELRDVKGVSVLLYDQTCAAEKRRRRKRGAYPDPDKRVIINALVCEGCGDCGVKSTASIHSWKRNSGASGRSTSRAATGFLLPTASARPSRCMAPRCARRRGLPEGSIRSKACRSRRIPPTATAGPHHRRRRRHR